MPLVMLPLLAALAFSPPEKVCDGISGARGFAAHAQAAPNASSLPDPKRKRRKVGGRNSSAALSRCVRYALLQRREALLHDFLVRARTETPEFVDARAYPLGVGVTIGPVIVTKDFVGSPIIRAKVSNRRGVPVSFLLSASIASDRGAQSGASTVVILHAFETRTIELLCPESITPRALTWSTLPL